SILLVELAMAVVIRVTSGPHSGEEYWLDRREEFLVGRSSRVHFPMTGDMLLSREHFRIDNQPPLCHLKDLGSTNGTKVTGPRVEGTRLRGGDVIPAGDSSFVIHFCESTGDGALMATCAGCGRRVAAANAPDAAISPAADWVRVGPDLWLCG